MNQLHGNLFLMAAGGLKGGYSSENLMILSKIAKMWRVNEVVVESNFGDGMFSALLQPVMGKIYPCGIVETRAIGQKEKRICDTLEPVMGSHRLVVNRQIIDQDIKVINEAQKYSLFYQMTRITRDRGALRHDDRLDAVEMAVRYWLESLGRDEDKASADHEAALLEADLKAFVDNCLIKHANKLSDSGLRQTHQGKWVNVRM